MCRSYDYLGSRRNGGFGEYVSVPARSKTACTFFQPLYGLFLSAVAVAILWYPHLKNDFPLKILVAHLISLIEHKSDVDYNVFQEMIGGIDEDVKKNISFFLDSLQYIMPVIQGTTCKRRIPSSCDNQTDRRRSGGTDDGGSGRNGQSLF